jgi:hypothetical protein
MIISSASLYAFMAGALLSLVWSLVALAICMHVQMPNASLYPEIDFASKCVEQSHEYPQTLGNLLYPLSNAESRQIRHRISDIRFYIGAQQYDNPDVRHVEISTNGQLGRLSKGEVYT